MGADVDSAVGRLLWGSRRVHVDAVGLLRSSDAVLRALAALAVLAVLAVLAAVRQRR